MGRGGPGWNRQTPDTNAFCRACGTPLASFIAQPAAPPMGPPPGLAPPVVGPPPSAPPPGAPPPQYQSPYYAPAPGYAQPPVHRTPWVLIVSAAVGLVVIIAVAGGQSARRASVPELKGDKRVAERGPWHLLADVLHADLGQTERAGGGAAVCGRQR